MAFPEQVTAGATALGWRVDAGPLYVNSRFFALGRDTGSNNIQMFASSDGVAWSQAGVDGPTISGVQTPVMMKIYGSVLVVVFTIPGDFPAVVRFNTNTDTWTAPVTTTNLPTPMNEPACCIAGDKVVVMGSNGDVQSYYFLFDLTDNSFTNWAPIGPNSFAQCRTLGVVKGTAGRVHFLGAAEDFVLSPDWVWSQTLYPATNTLIAEDVFADADEPEVFFSPVSVSSGTVFVALTDAVTTDLNAWVAESADTLVWSTIPYPAFSANFTNMGTMGNDTNGFLIVARSNFGGVNGAYEYATFDGATFGAWVSIGASPSLIYPDPDYQFCMSSSNRFFGITWNGSIFFWGLLFAPGPRVVTIILVGRQQIPC